ncbi:hypothetical protein C8R47DRAFT_962300 [Mycena vitilis]|nr:hypothetical protein C8R47DRAFT_962300 [Mycena vitilis]
MATAVPSIRLIVPTPDASAYTEDANSVSVSISPGASGKKKSVLGRVAAVQTPYNTVRGGVDFSDIVRRVGGAGESAGGTWRAGDENWGGEGEGMVLIKKKAKTRGRVDGVFALADVTNANANARPETPVEAKDKWWNLTRGRKDTGSGVLKGLVRRGKCTRFLCFSNARPVEFKRSASAMAVYSDAPAPNNNNTNAKQKPSEFQRTLVGSGILLGAPASTLGRAPTPAALSRAPTPVPGPRSGTPTMGGLLAPPGAVPLKDKEQGSIAVRAMRSVRSMARLGGWEKEGENGKENSKEKEGEGREGEGTLRGKKKVKVKVKVKEEKVKEKDKKEKDKKEKGKRAPKSSGSSFEVGALGASPGSGVSIGKSGGVSIGMGLPSALTLGRSNGAGGKASTASSVGGPAFVPNNAPATVNPNRLSAESAMNVKRASTNSSLRPLSVLSSGSSAGSRVSSGSSVRWAEEVVDRMRGRDRGEREKEKAEREKERERRKTERDSRRTSEGRKRTPLSDVFPGLSRRSSGAESANGLPMLTVEEATTDGHGHGDEEEEENETGYEIVSATPVKRPRLRPMSDEVTNGRGKSRPRGIIEDSAADGVLNLLDAATNDLAQLITHLDLEATPGTPSPGRGPMVPRKEWEESPSKSRTLRPSDGSVSSLRPYAARGGSTTPSMLGKQIAPWPTASPPPAPAAVPTDATFKRMHRRTMTPTPEPDPEPVFHPLRLRPSRIRPVLSVTTSASASPPPPSDDQMQIDGRAPSSLTFGSRSSSGSVEDAEALRRARGLPPVFTRGHARNRSSLLPDAPSPKSSQGSTLGMPLAREAKRVLGMGGTMGGSAASGYEEQELDASDPDSDIPNELQAILSSCGQSPIDDTLSFRPPSVHAQLPSPGLPPHLPLPGSPSPASSPLPQHLQLPVLNIQLIDDEGHHGDIDEASSEEDTKKSFDFTGELQKLNESGASDRRSFVEQLENAFKTPAKLDLRGLLCVEVPPPMPPIPVTLKQDTSGSSTASSEQSSSGFQVPQSVSRLVDMKQPTMGNSSEEDSSEDVHMFSVSRIVDLKEPTLLPGSDSLASDDSLLPPRPFAAGPSDGQLNVKFKFGGELPAEEKEREKPKPKPMQSKKPLTLSDIIPPPAHVRSQSLSSLLEEDSSVLHSIFMHAAETAAEVPRPRVNSDSSTRGFMAENSRSSMASFHSRSRSRPQSGISFTGFDSFEEVRRGFEFHNNRPAFYPPPVTNTRRVPHARQDSLFSIASVSSYGHVTNPGAMDPFEYGLAMPSLRERPSSEDLSVSMSNFEDTFAFTRDPQRKRVASDASSFYFKAPGQPSARGHARRESNMSVSSQGPPNSFYNYNRSYASHRLSENDTSTSGSSLAHQYAAYGANGGRAAWAKHRQDSSVDSDYSVSRLGRPGVGEKMFARADHGMPLTAISASPTESHSNRSSFDSILDEEQRSSMEDSLFEKTGHRSSMSGDSVFGDPNPYDHYRAPHGHLLPPNHFRPLSVLSFNNDHSPMKEDDTQIQMLGGGHVRRKSIGSMYDASPCVRVEKRKHVAFQEDDAPSKARVLTAQASIASTSSSKFGGERMIRATQGLLVRHSLEDTALQAEGEDLSVFRPAAVFFRPSPNSRSRSSTVTTSSSGAETPPLSPAEGSSMSDGSMSSIDIDMSQVNVMLSNATHPMSSTARDRVRARARGQGHRRRGSAAQTRASRSSRSSVYETIQEEFPSPPSTVGSKKSGSPTAHQGVWVVEADEAGSMDLSTGWDDERGIIALRRYYALRHEADDAVTESRPFSPPKNPEGMQALLQHSVQNYGPLPSELGPRRVRSRTSSRASPYPRQGLIPASPDQQRSSPAALHRLASSPLRPLEVNPNVDVHMSPVVLSPKRENAWGLAPNARPRVASATRRTALGWTRRSTKASMDLKENNTSMSGIPGDSLRLSRPRPRGRPTPARAAPPMPRQAVAAI